MLSTQNLQKLKTTLFFTSIYRLKEGGGGVQGQNTYIYSPLCKVPFLAVPSHFTSASATYAMNNVSILEKNVINTYTSFGLSFGQQQINKYTQKIPKHLHTISRIT